jgi:hypothetical protein
MEKAARSHNYQASYQAFILRCWIERGSAGEKPVWRFSLEPVAGGGRLGFSDLKTLVSFLEHQTGEVGVE